MKALSVDRRGRLRLNEAQVAEQCLSFLRLQGWLPVRTDVIRARSERGFISQGEVGQPDYVICHPIRPVWWLETKRHGGKVSGEQTRWHEWARVSGYTVCVIPPEAEDPFAWFVAWYEEQF
jgi:hypothetical protein